MKNKNFKNNEGGGTGKILEFQRAQLKRLEFEEPISNETKRLLELMLEFVSEAQELTTVPQPKKVDVKRKLLALRGKMALLNKVSATGKELLLSEGHC